jgi:hypothetical protein
MATIYRNLWRIMPYRAAPVGLGAYLSLNLMFLMSSSKQKLPPRSFAVGALSESFFSRSSIFSSFFPVGLLFGLLIILIFFAIIYRPDPFWFTKTYEAVRGNRSRRARLAGNLGFPDILPAYRINSK